MLSSVPTQSVWRSSSLMSGMRTMYGVSVRTMSVSSRSMVFVEKTSADAGDVHDPGDAGLDGLVVALDQAGEQVGLPVAQANDGLDLPRADDRLRDPRAEVHRAGEIRDLDLDLEGDLLVVMDARLDLERDPDVLIGERRDRDDVAADGLRAVERRVRDRHAIGDDDLGLLPLADPKLRLGDRLGVGVALQEVQHDGRNRPEQPVPLLLDRR